MSARLAWVTALVLAALTAAAGAPASGAPAPAGTRARPADAAAEADGLPPGAPPMAGYQFGLLVRGAGWTPEHSARTDSIQAGHMANIRRMASLGKLLAAGPFLDDGPMRGIFIFQADSLGEARALAAGDPAIASGRLDLELWDWMAPAGIGARYRAEATKPGHRDSMVRVVFGFLDKGAAFASGDSAQAERDQRAHVARILAAIADGTLLTAGPLEEAGEHRGVFVCAPGTTPEAARAWWAGDPHVKSGRLQVVLHPWMFADGTFR